MPAALAASSCVNTNPCVLSCEGCDIGEYVPDPADCSGYYRCMGTGEDDVSDDAFDCGSGKVFDLTTHLCVAGDTCNACATDPLSCIYECPADGTVELIPSFADCNVYYLCSGGDIQYTVNCDDPNPYFDGEECQASASRCCYCHPYCDQDAAENTAHVSDPQDCRRYYTCFAVGTPVDFTECPDGEYYDTAADACSSKISCYTRCTNVVGEDGCIDPFTCQAAGYFAKCPGQCTADYYHCAAPTGEYQAAASCISGTVFHPSSHTCVSPDDCP